jgi:hypothetical protein
MENMFSKGILLLVIVAVLLVIDTQARLPLERHDEYGKLCSLFFFVSVDKHPKQTYAKHSIFYKVYYLFFGSLKEFLGSLITMGFKYFEL